MNTNFQNALDHILPPKIINGKTYKPDITTSNNIRQDFYAPRTGRSNHGGVDINYHHESGSPIGQNGINLQHPNIGSPVSGTIKDIDRERFGKITILDANGNTHELIHLNEIPRGLNKGDSVSAGQVIGSMGGRGPGGSNQYPQHVHYTITAPDGKTKINPETYWNNPPDGKDSSSSFPWQGKTDFKPASVLDDATQQRLKRLPQGITISSGETLRREGDKVLRIDRDGGTRGYFISP